MPHHGIALGARAVEDTFQQVTRPVDALVQVAPEKAVVGAAGGGYAAAGKFLVLHSGYQRGVGASSHASGEVV